VQIDSSNDKYSGLYSESAEVNEDEDEEGEIGELNNGGMILDK
jgi:hypothetical protein